MKRIIITLHNSLSKNSGITLHLKEMYEKYNDYEFIEFSIFGNENLYKKIGNVDRRILNKSSIKNIISEKNNLIIFTTFDKRFKGLEKFSNENEVWLIDHGTWPGLYINKKKFKHIQLSKKIWAHWNFMCRKYLKDFIKNTNVISFSLNDLKFFEISGKKLEFIPIFELPKLSIKKDLNLKHNIFNPARPSIQKNTKDILKWVPDGEKITIAGKIDTNNPKIINVLKNKRINYIGEIDKLSMLQNILNSDKIILISKWEGFPRVMIESILLRKKFYTTNSFSEAQNLQELNFLKIINDKNDIVDFNPNFDAFENYINEKIKISNKNFDFILKKKN